MRRFMMRVPKRTRCLPLVYHVCSLRVPLCFAGPDSTKTIDSIVSFFTKGSLLLNRNITHNRKDRVITNQLTKKILNKKFNNVKKNTTKTKESKSVDHAAIHVEKKYPSQYPPTV
jgi:hypothetical protein